MLVSDFSEFIHRKSERGIFGELEIGRMAAFLVQDGKCYITGTPLLAGRRELHHRLPREYDGSDAPENLVYLDIRIHHAVHTASKDEFRSLLYGMPPLNRRQFRLLNQLRTEAYCKPFPYEEHGI